MRAVCWLGLSYRRSSSTAVGRTSGSVAQALQVGRVAQQGEHAVADQVRRGLQAADHRDDAVGHHLLVGEPVAVHLGGQERADQPVARVAPLLADGVVEVGGEVLDGLEHTAEQVGVVLEVAEHLGEGDRPVLELDVVLDRHAEQFGRHDGGQRLGEVGQHVHAAGAARLDVVDQAVGDVLDVRAKLGHVHGQERRARQPPQPRVRGRVEEEHLLDHHLGDRPHLRHAQRLEVLRASACGRRRTGAGR